MSLELILNPEKVIFCFGMKEVLSGLVIKPKESKSYIDAVVLSTHF